MRLRLHRLEIAGPQLAGAAPRRRRIFVAGLPVEGRGGQGDFAHWLLDQREIVIRDARLVWTTPCAGPRIWPSTSSSSASRTAAPTTASACGPSRRPARGGPRCAPRPARRDPANLAEWRGELYAALDYAALGAWRPWVDYPSTWMAPAACGWAGGRRRPAGRGDRRFRAARRPRPPGAELDDIPSPAPPGACATATRTGLTEASGRKLSRRPATA